MCRGGGSRLVPGLFELRCPKCGHLGAVEVCRSWSNLWRGAVNVILGPMFGDPSLLTLDRKCLDCGIWFHDQRVWRSPSECS